MDADIRFAVESVTKAGELILSYYRNSYEVAEKGRNNPVTTADLAADDYLRRVLSERFPGDGWISEESGASAARLSKQTVWVVDPLDGTKEFVQGIPDFAVSVGRVRAGRPVLAVVYNPARGDLFFAERGKGAFRNGLRLRLPEKEASGFRLLVSRTEHAAGLFDAIPGSASMRILGSIAYKLALLAAGEADVVISLRPKNEWDVCAGDLLVEEAGGRVSDLEGRALAYNKPKTRITGIVAAGPGLYESAMEWVRSRASNY